MNPSSEMRVFVLSDRNVVEPRQFRPQEVVEPEDILFAGFFYDEDSRAAFLSGLRQIATESAIPTSASLEEEVAAEIADFRLRGDAAGLLLATLRWWTVVGKRGYHAYKLRVGVDRYRCSCIIAFRERTPEDLRTAIMPAVEELEEAKERVAGFFQYPFD